MDHAGGLPAGTALDQLLPPVPAGAGAALWRRSALASTLLAGLELSREGAVRLEQEVGFETVWVSPGVVRSFAGNRRCGGLIVHRTCTRLPAG